MTPGFEANGPLPAGVHWATWDDLVDRIGTNPWREHLLTGFRAALEEMKAAGWGTVYLDGSIVASKDLPNDYDDCWQEVGVNPEILDPVLLTFAPGRATQKSKCRGELFPASITADRERLSFLDFFQTDKDTGQARGFVAIDLGGPR